MTLWVFLILHLNWFFLQLSTMLRLHFEITFELPLKHMKWSFVEMITPKARFAISDLLSIENSFFSLSELFICLKVTKTKWKFDRWAPCWPSYQVHSKSIRSRNFCHFNGLANKELWAQARHRFLVLLSILFQSKFSHFGEFIESS